MSGTTMPLVDWSKSSGGGAAGGNMLGMVGEAMKLRQTGQEFAARQRFGQIMAGAGGDMETALQQAQQDPLVGAFAPQLMTEIRQQMMIGSQAQQAQLGVANSAREGLLHVLQTVTDPTKLTAALQSQFAVHDRRTQEIVKPYGDSVVSSLTAGLPSDPAAAQQEFAKRKAQMMVSTGLLPSIGVAAGAGGFGIPSIHDVPGVGPTGVVQDPFGGGIRIVGSPPPAPGNSLTPGGGAAPSAPGLAVPTPNPAAPTTTGPGGAPPAAAPAQPPVPVSSVDNKPLYDPATNYTVPYSFGTGGTGAPILSQPLQKEAEKLAEEHGGKNLEAYRAAQQTQSSLTQMDAAYDQLIQGGGFLQPGALAKFRADIAGAANTVSQLLGKEPYFDPSKVASAEQFAKETGRMGLQVGNQFLGGSREAAETIKRIATTVPSIENSYLGGKLIIAGIRASNQRLMDERAFLNSWVADPKHGGNLLGAAEAFNARAPASDYANKELDSFGLKPDGTFKSLEDLVSMQKRGLMTPRQIRDIAAKQFPESLK